MPRALVILAIRAYQRFISPYKGFCCAYRVHTGRCSCSEFGRRAVARKGVFTGLMLIDARLQRCGEMHRRHARRLSAQRGVIDCDFVPDVSDACDCADVCSPGCDGCDWRNRRKSSRERNVRIKPGRWPDGDASNQR
ncbi:membrane protein insertion efficiency factor YidD [Burkholderiaceae bacterium UC74_6]